MYIAVTGTPHHIKWSSPGICLLVMNVMILHILLHHELMIILLRLEDDNYNNEHKYRYKYIFEISNSCNKKIMNGCVTRICCYFIKSTNIIS